MVKIVSFNVRYPNPFDGINDIKNRVPLIANRIQCEKPDIIGFQEVDDYSESLLAKALPEYLLLGTGPDANLADVGNRIAILKSSVSLLAFDQLWLSPTMRIPGSRFPIQSTCSRMVLWVKVIHRQSGRAFYFMNTHLDHESDEARMLGLDCVLTLAEDLKAIEHLPIFIAGDFNFTPEQLPYTLIEKSTFSDLTDSLNQTFHAFTGVNFEKADYILGDTAGEYCASQWYECHDGIYLSDHDAVCIEWK